MDVIKTVHPKVVTIDIGSNDLCDPSMLWSEQFLNIIELPGHILVHTTNIQSVVVMQIIHRGSMWHPHKVEQNLAQYNHTVDQTYTFLYVQCYEGTLPGFECFTLRKLPTDLDSFLLPDGVHWNARGEATYRHSYRGALLEGFNKLNSS